MSKKPTNQKILQDQDTGFENDNLMLAIQAELDKIVTQEVCNAVYEVAYRAPTKKTDIELNKNCKNRKSVIMNAILASVNIERVYFIMRSSIRGLMTGVATYAVISFFFITNFFVLVLLGVFFFVVSLVLSRFLDKSIINLSYKIVNYLRHHKKMRVFLLNRF
jgi:hypothetical protein